MSPPNPALLPPLLRIPTELRLEIFDYLDIPRQTITQQVPISINDDGIDTPPIARTCRLLHEEAMEFYFRNNRFTISTLMGLPATLQRTGPRNIFRMTHLRLLYQGWQPNTPDHVMDLVRQGNDYVDVDILDKEPWFRVCGPSIELAATRIETTASASASSTVA